MFYHAGAPETTEEVELNIVSTTEDADQMNRTVPNSDYQDATSGPYIPALDNLIIPPSDTKYGMENTRKYENISDVGYMPMAPGTMRPHQHLIKSTTEIKRQKNECNNSQKHQSEASYSYEYIDEDEDEYIDPEKRNHTGAPETTEEVELNIVSTTENADEQTNGTVSNTDYQDATSGPYIPASDNLTIPPSDTKYGIENTRKYENIPDVGYMPMAPGTMRPHQHLIKSTTEIKRQKNECNNSQKHQSEASHSYEYIDEDEYTDMDPEKGDQMESEYMTIDDNKLYERLVTGDVNPSAGEYDKLIQEEATSEHQ